MKKLLMKLTTTCTICALSFSLIPTIQVNAASPYIEARKIIGNGVRLRQEGHDNGTILELMYEGEKIYFYPTIYGTDTEYNYMRRYKTGTYGYVNHDFTRL